MFSNLMGHLVHILNLFDFDEVFSCNIFFFSLPFEVIKYPLYGVALRFKDFVDL